MKLRRLSLVVLLLLLAGLQFIVMGSGGSVKAELPLPTPPEEPQSTMVSVDAFSRVRLPNDMPRYDIPLPLQLQKYIWEQCEEYDIPYELVLAVIKAESDFVVDAVGVTNDLGLMQLNPYNTMDWLAENVGIENFDPFNPFHNVTAGIWYLAYIRDHWVQYEACQQQTFAYMILSYHRGIWGAKKYVQKLGTRAFTNSYLVKVSEYKHALESGQ